MVFWYPILIPIVNEKKIKTTYSYQLKIVIVKLIFHVEAQIPPSNTIEMYLQKYPKDYSCRPSIPFNE